jgi:hypothetical protein
MLVRGGRSSLSAELVASFVLSRLTATSASCPHAYSHGPELLELPYGRLGTVVGLPSPPALSLRGMSFSDEEDDEFDLLPLPDVDFAALDLSSYTVVPSQAAFRPPPPHVIKRERGLPADEEWDIPIRVGQDGTYGLKVSPIKGTSAPPPAARPPPPAPVVPQQQQQQHPTADAYPASQQQIPLSQAAATRRAAALAYAASTSTGAGPSASASTRGQSAPPVQPAGRLVGGFSQRPLGPPPFVPPQATARAGSVGPAARGTHLGHGPARPGLRAGSRGPTPGPTSRGPSPVPFDGASAQLQVDSDLAALRRQNEVCRSETRRREAAETLR